MPQMFERISFTAPGLRKLSNEQKQYNEENDISPYTVQVLSSPGIDMPEEIATSIDNSLPPWILSFEDFLSPEECAALIDLGNEYEFSRSKELGPQRFDGTFESVVSDRMTFDEVWCSDRLGCRYEDVATRVHERIAKVLAIPSDNTENLQIMRYQESQFARTHHDFHAHQVDRQCGPRILTFHIFLSDADAGGGVEFPYFNIKIRPKKGAAILWPNVLNSSPMTQDGRLIHQVLEVESGVVYSLDAYTHLFDYLTPHMNGCY